MPCAFVLVAALMHAATFTFTECTDITSPEIVKGDDVICKANEGRETTTDFVSRVAARSGS